MTFVHPLFLWALTAVAVPIIIHLFNFRKYKKVYFTNVKFLKELQHESKSRSRLKEILVLISRCLLIASLVLAFCQPIIPEAGGTAKNTGAKAISIYIDNSFSMENVNKQGPILELAKTRAKEVVTAFDNLDHFQVLTNDFEGRHQRFNSREDALNLIDEVKISSSLRSLSEVLKRQTEFLNTSGINNRRIYVFSDAQRSTFNFADLKPDTSINTTIIPIVANQVNNVFVDSCWFETPLQQIGFIQKLHARIINQGNAGIDAGSAKLFLNGQQISLASFSLDAGSARDILFTFECKQSGFNYGSVKIEDYPVIFDDELFFAFNSKINVSVSLVKGKGSGENNYFSSLFGNDSLFSFKAFDEQTIDYNAFKKSDVIILDQLSELSSGLLSELIKFTNQGGALVIVPSQNAGLRYNRALGALRLPLLGAIDSTHLKTDKIEPASEFYAGVFEKIDERVNLPLVNKHFKLIRGSRSDFESILKLQNGDDFLGKAVLNNSSIYLLSCPLNETSTNFSKHALFVPTFYRICFGSLKAVPLFYPVSANVVINIKNDLSAGDRPPHIKKLDHKTDVIPEMRVVNNSLFLYTRNQVSSPGFYEVNWNNLPLLPLAFNYSRKEAYLLAYDSGQLMKIISDKAWPNFRLIEDTRADIPGQVLIGAEGKKLWKLFIILALAFIIIEVALLRLLK